MITCSDSFVLILRGFVFQYLKQAASGVHCKGSGTICPSFDACLYLLGVILAMPAMRCHAVAHFPFEGYMTGCLCC